MKKAVIVGFLLSALVLQGCALFENKKDVILPPVQLDPRVLEPCAPLVEIDRNTTDTFAAIMDNVAANTLIYRDCRTKQDTSILLIKKLTSKEE